MIELKFTLDDDLTKNNLIQLLSIHNYQIAIDEIQDLFRSILKYESFDHKELTLSEETYDLIEKMRDKVCEICEDLPKEY